MQQAPDPEPAWSPWWIAPTTGGRSGQRCASHARWNSVTDEMEVTFEIGPADGPNKYTYGGVDEAA